MPSIPGAEFFFVEEAASMMSSLVIGALIASAVLAGSLGMWRWSGVMDDGFGVNSDSNQVRKELEIPSCV